MMVTCWSPAKPQSSRRRAGHGGRLFRDTRLALALSALGLYAVTLNMIPLGSYRAAAMGFTVLGLFAVAIARRT
ncbi:hypothetical protein Mth01_48290 [Sphaerimonospora thailandensis]|uniref:Uncharacterized protein n=1 Tax=Sphaerimonospora thailandensis TaxID=795644 RepID=A0A8J3RE38_9ACTN|nr:hypothetical protein Mth01_48290 [Sphaerimonospora thailandensis]